MMTTRRVFSFLSLVATAALGSTTAVGESPSYREDRDFLAAHTRVVELVGDNGARVVVCPDLQGRVMTSTCGGEEGPSFGWINRDFISAGQTSDVFNNYGGEDRFWLGPEGGPYALWFKPDAEQKFANWHTPADLNTGGFNLLNPDPTKFCLMNRRIIVQNAAAKEFDVSVVRAVRMQSSRDMSRRLGSQIAEAASGLEMVGFRSENKLSDLRGNPWSAEGGLLSIWILGMFPPGEHAAVILPYVAGDDAELGPVVNTGYFAEPPADRMHVTSAAVLFRADGNYRGKIGLSQKRAKSIIGSIDFDRGVLTLVQFNLPDDPTAEKYVNNFWEVPQAEPFVGDVVNSYNDGPPEPGMKNLGGFYELETMSPTAELESNDAIRHDHATFHFRGDKAQLAPLAKAALGVDLDEVERFLAK